MIRTSFEILIPIFLIVFVIVIRKMVIKDNNQTKGIENISSSIILFQFFIDSQTYVAKTLTYNRFFSIAKMSKLGDLYLIGFVIPPKILSNVSITQYISLTSKFDYCSYFPINIVNI